jgi:DNA end-binding protein Ku
LEEREVPYSEIKKGYEISKEKYVVLEPEDFDKIRIESTKTIDIKEFVDEPKLDPLFIEKSYYLAPDTGNKGKNRRKKANSDKISVQDKSYSLLVKVLNENKKAAIGKVVLRGEKEHLVAIRANQKGLVMHTLHYIDEIRPVEEIEEISKSKVPAIDEKEMSLGKLLVQNLSSDDFDISQYHDNYTQELEKMIIAKSKGRILTVKQPQAEPSDTKDLISALKASLEHVPKSRKK